MGIFTGTRPADCHMHVHLIFWYAVNVSRVFCASCSITCVRPWNAITPKASNSSILLLPPSSSPPAATSVCFSLVFPNVNSLEGYRGAERIPDIFPSPVREAALSLWSCNKTHQRWAGDKGRTRDIFASVDLTHMPQRPRIHLPDMLEVWYLWTFLHSS